ncbi:helix-turn-helix domain-containing protein [Streptomyces sp. SAI-127]|uniref:helix-turn-helix domain-containing protein n=1 Tax=Streptomyces sp. SAI-127 TaxID=2940543 RepID=UPI002472FFF1|nr:helix-turn-helix domain-containing protein [Streptomyces sp. SAI-127]MDH6489581.1 ABC-type enterochelin transport system ATPase subunit [Streptomyces sp. SAI-127]
MSAVDAPARTLTGSMPVGVGRGELLAVARRLVGAPEGATWWRGRDLVAVARAADLAASLPALDEDQEEPRLAALVMAEVGMSIEDTATRLGTYDRQVSRWREAAEAGRA